MLLAACLIVLASNFYSSEATDYGVSFSFYRGQTVNDPFYNYTLGSSISCDISSKVDLTNHKLLFYVHGYEEDLNDYENLLINVTSRTLTDYIIVKVNYNYNEFYLATAISLPAIGKQIGEFMLCLNKKGYSLNNIVCVGHSYEAHLCGIAGKTVNGLLRYIVGLDPASLITGISGLSKLRLTKDDAQLVQAIHTSNILGTTLRCGRSDFWINGGVLQTGCSTTISNCSHIKAILYYVDSLVNIIIGTSKLGFKARMGGDPLESGAIGNYYLTI